MCSTKAYTIKSTVNTSKASIKVLAEIEIFDFAKEARFLYPFNYGDILNCVKALELNENNMCSTKAYTIKSTVNTSKASIKVLAEIEIFDFAKEARFLYPFNYGDILNCVKALELNENNMCSTKAYTIKSTVNTSKASIKVLAEIEIFDFAKEARFLYPFNYGDILNCVKALELNENNMCSTKAYTIKSTVNTSKASIKVLAEIEIFDFAKEARFLYPFNYGDILNCVKALELNENNMCSTKAYTIKSTVNTSKASIKVLAEIEIFDFAKEARFLYPFNYGDILNCVKALELNENNMCSTKAYTIKSTVNTSKASIKVLAEIEIFDFAKEARFLYPFNYGDILNCVKALELNENNMCSTKAYTIKSTVNTSKASIKVLAEIEIFDFAKEARFLYPFNYGDILNCVKALELNENNMCSTKAYTIKSTVNTSKASIKVLAEIEIFDFAKEARFLYPFNYGDILNCVKALELNENNMCSTKAYTIKSTVNTSKASIKVLAEIEIFDFAKEARFLYPFNYGDILNCVKALELNENNMCSTKAYTIKSTVNTSKASIKVLAEIEIFDFAKEARFLYPFNYGDILNCVKALELNENNMCSTKAYTIKSTVNTSKASIKVLAEIEIFDFAKEARFLYPFNYGDILNCVKALELNENNMCSTKAYTIKSTVNTSKASIKVLAEIEIFDFAKEARFLYPFNYGDILNCVKALELNENNMCSTKAYTIKSTVNTSKASIKVLAEIEIFDFAKEARFLYPFNYGDILNCVKALELNENNMCSTKAYTIKSTVNTSKASIKVLAEIEIFDFAKEARFLYPFNYGDILNCVKALELNENNMCSTKAYTIKSTVNTSKASIKVLAEIEIFDFAKEARFLYPFNYGDILNCVKALELNENNMCSTKAYTIKSTVNTSKASIKVLAEIEIFDFAKEARFLYPFNYGDILNCVKALELNENNMCSTKAYTIKSTVNTSKASIKVLAEIEIFDFAKEARFLYPFNYGDILNCVKALELNENNMCSTKAYTIKSTVNTSKASIKVLAEIEIFDFAKEARFLYPFNYGDILNCVKALELNENNMCSTKAYTIKSTVNTSKASIKVLAEIEIFDFAKEARFLYPFNYGDILNCVKALELNENNMCSTKAYTIKSTVNTSKASIKVLAEIEIFDFAKEARFLYPFNYGDILNCVKALELNENNMCSTKAYTIKSTVNTSKASIKVLAEIEIFDFAKEARFLYPFNYGDILNCVKALELNENNMCSTKAYTIKSTVNTSKASIKVLAEIEIFDFAKEARFLYPFNYGDILNCVKALELNENNMCSTKAYTIKSTVNTSKASIKVLAEIEIFDFAKEARFLYPFNYGDILNCVKALELNENNMCSTKAYTIKSTVNTSKASIKVLAEIEIFDFAKEARFLYPFNYGDILNCVKALELNENNMCSTKAYTIKSTVNTSKASIKVLAEIEIFDFAKEARFLYPFNYGDILNCVKALELNENNMCSTKAYTIKSTVNTSKASIKVLAEIEIFDFAKEARFLYPFNYGDILNCVKALELNENNMCSTKAYTIKSTVNTSKASIKVLAEIEIFDFAKEARFLYPFNYGDILNCVKALELNENNMCSTKAYTIKSTVNTSKASIKVLAEIEIFDFAKEARFLYPFNYGDILNCVKALELNENNMCSTKAYTIKSTVNTSKASIKVLAEIEIFDFAKEARFLYPFNYGDILNCVKALELNENNMCSTKAYTIKSTVNTSKASIKVLAEIEIFDFAKEARFLYPFNYGDILNCVKALELNENNMCSTKAYTIKSTVNTSKASIKVLAEIEIFDFAKEARFLYPFNYGDILNCVKALELNENNMCSTKAYTIKSTVNTSKASIKVLAEIEIFDFAKEARFLYPFNYGDILNCVKALELNENNMCSTKAYTIKSTVNTSKASIKVLAEIEIFDFAKEARFLYPFNYGDILNCVKALELNENNMCSTKAYTIKSTVNTSKASIKVLAEIEIFDFAKEARFLYPFNYGDILNCVKALELNENNMCSTKAYTIKSTVNTSKASIKVLAEIEIFDFAKEARFLYPFNYGDILNCVKALELNENNMCSTKAYTIKSTVNTSKASIKVLAEIEIFDFAKEARFLYPFNYGDILNCVKALELNENNMCSTKAYTIKSTVNTSKASIKVLAEIEIFDFAKEARFLYPFNYGDILNCVKALELNENNMCSTKAYTIKSTVNTSKASIKVLAEIEIFDFAKEARFLYPFNYGDILNCVKALELNENNMCSTKAYTIKSTVNTSKASIKVLAEIEIFDFAKEARFLYPFNYGDILNCVKALELNENNMCSTKAYTIKSTVNTSKASIKVLAEIEIFDFAKEARFLYPFNYGDILNCVKALELNENNMCSTKAYTIKSTVNTSKASIKVLAEIEIFDFAKEARFLYPFNYGDILNCVKALELNENNMCSTKAYTIKSTVNTSKASIKVLAEIEIFDFAKEARFLYPFNYGDILNCVKALELNENNMCSTKAYTIKSTVNTSKASIKVLAEIEIFDFAKEARFLYPFNYGDILNCVKALELNENNMCSTKAYTIKSTVNTSKASIKVLAEIEIFDFAKEARFLYPFNYGDILNCVKALELNENNMCSTKAYTIKSTVNTSKASIKVLAEIEIFDFAKEARFLYPFNYGDILNCVKALELNENNMCSTKAYTIKSTVNTSKASIKVLAEIEIFDFAKEARFLYPFNYGDILNCVKALELNENNMCSTKAYTIKSTVNTSKASIKVLAEIEIFDFAKEARFLYPFNYGDILNCVKALELNENNMCSTKAYTIKSTVNTSKASIKVLAEIEIFDFAKEARFLYPFNYGDILNCVKALELNENNMCSTKAYTIKSTVNTSKASIKVLAEIEIFDFAKEARFLYPFNYGDILNCVKALELNENNMCSTKAYTIKSTVNTSKASIKVLAEIEIFDFAKEARFLYPFNYGDILNCVKALELNENNMCSTKAYTIKSTVNTSKASIKVLAEIEIFDFAKEARFLYPFNYGDILNCVKALELNENNMCSTKAYTIKSTVNTSKASIKVLAEIEIFDFAKEARFLYPFNYGDILNCVKALELNENNMCSTKAYTIKSTVNTSKASIKVLAEIEIFDFAKEARFLYPFNYGDILNCVKALELNENNMCSTKAYTIKSTVNTSKASIKVLAEIEIFDFAKEARFLYPFNYGDILNCVKALELNENNMCSTKAYTIKSTVNTSKASIKVLAEIEIFDFAKEARFLYPFNYGDILNCVKALELNENNMCSTKAYTIKSTVNTSKASIKVLAEIEIFDFAKEARFLYPFNYGDILNCVKALELNENNMCSTKAYTIKSTVNTSKASIKVLAEIEIFDFAKEARFLYPFNYGDILNCVKALELNENNMCSTKAYTIKSTVNTSKASIKVLAEIEIFDFAKEARFLYPFNYGDILNCVKALELNENNMCSTKAYTIKSTVNTSKASIKVLAEIEIFDFAKEARFLYPFNYGDILNCVKALELNENNMCSTKAYTIKSTVNTSKASIKVLAEIEIFDFAKEARFLYPFNYGDILNCVKALELNENNMCSTKAYTIKSTVNTSKASIKVLAEIEIFDFAKEARFLYPFNYGDILNCVKALELNENNMCSTKAYTIKSTVNTSKASIKVLAEIEIFDFAKEARFLYPFNYGDILNCVKALELNENNMCSTKAYTIKSTVNTSKASIKVLAEIEIFDFAKEARFLYPFNYGDILNCVKALELNENNMCSTKAYTIKSTVNTSKASIKVLAEIEIFDFAKEARFLYPFNYGDILNCVKALELNENNMCSTKAYTIKSTVNTSKASIKVLAEIEIFDFAKEARFLYPFNYGDILNCVKALELNENNMCSTKAYTIKSTVNTSKASIKVLAEIEIFDFAKEARFLYPFNYGDILNCVKALELNENNMCSTKAYTIKSTVNTSKASIKVLAEIEIFDFAKEARFLYPFNYGDILNCVKALELNENNMCSTKAYTIKSTVNTSKASIKVLAEIEIFDFAKEARFLYPFNYGDILNCVKALELNENNMCSTKAYTIKSTVNTSKASIKVLAEIEIFDFAKEARFLYPFNYGDILNCVKALELNENNMCSTKAYTIKSTVNTSKASIKVLAEIEIFDFAKEARFLYPFNYGDILNCVKALELNENNMCSTKAYTIKSTVNTSKASIKVLAEIEIFDFAKEARFLYPFNYGDILNCVKALELNENNMCSTKAYTIKSTVNTSKASIKVLAEIEIFDFAKEARFLYPFNYGDILNCVKALELNENNMCSTKAYTIKSTVNTSKASIKVLAEIEIFDFAKEARFLYPFNYGDILNCVKALELNENNMCSTKAYTIKSTVNTSKASIKVLAEIEIFDFAKEARFLYPFNYGDILNCVKALELNENNMCSTKAYTIKSTVNTSKASIKVLAEIEIFDFAKEARFLYPFNYGDILNCVKALELNENNMCSTKAYTIKSTVNTSKASIKVLAEIEIFDFAKEARFLYPFNYGDILNCVKALELNENNMCSTKAYTIKSTVNTSKASIKVLAEIEIFDFAKEARFLYPFNYGDILNCVKALELNENNMCSTKAYTIKSTVNTSKASIKVLAEIEIFDFAKEARFLYPFNYGDILNCVKALELNENNMCSTKAYTIKSTVNTSKASIKVLAEIEIFDFAKEARFLYPFNYGDILNCVKALELNENNMCSTKAYTIKSTVNTSKASIKVLAEIEIFDFAKEARFLYPFNYGDILNCVKALELNENNMCSTKAYTIKSTVNTSKASIKVLAEIEIFDFAKEARFLYPFNYGDILNCVKALELNENNMCSTKAYTIKSTVNTSKASIKVLAEIEIFDFAKEARFLYPFNYGDILNCVKALELNENNMCSTKAYTIKSTVNTSKASIKVLAEIEIFDFAKEARFLYPFNYGDILNCVKALELNENNMCSTKAYTIKSTVNTSKASIKVLAEIEIFDFAKEARFLYPFNYGDILNCVKALELNENNMCSTKAYTIKSTVNTSKASIKVLAEIEIFDFAKEARFLYPFNYGDILNCVKALELNENNMCSTKAYTIKSTVNTSKASIKVLAEIEIFDFAKEARFLYPFNYGDILNCVKALELNENNMCSTKAYTIKSTVNTSKASIKVLAEIEIFDFAKEARFLYPFNYGDILNCVKALELNENNMCSTKAYTIKSTVNTSKASIKVLAEIEIFDFAKEARFLYPFNYGDILNCVKALELNENNMCSTKAYTIKSTVNTSKASIKVLAEIEIFDFAKEARFLYPFNYGDILNCVKALELNENNMCSTKAYTIKSTVNTSKASIKVLAEIEIFDFAKEARFLYPFNYGDILNCVKALELNENNMCSTKAYTIKSTVNTSKASIKVLAEIEIFDFAKEARFLYPFNYGDILNCVKALELNENNMCSTKAYTIKSTVNTSKASIKVLAEIEIFDFAKEARFLYPFNYGDILNCVKALELNENNMCSTKAYTIKSTVNTSKASIKVLAEIEIFDFAKEARFLYPFNYGDILNCVKALELNENNMCSTKAYTIKSTVNTSKASIKVLAEIEIFDFAKEARFLYPFNYGDILNCVKALELNENNMCSTKAYTIKSTVNTSKASIKVLAEIEIFDFAKEARFLYPFNYGDILNCVKALELNENNMCSTKAYTIKSTVNTSKASIKVLAEIEIFDFAKEARFLYPFNYGDILNCVKALELNENNMCSTKAYTIKSTVNTSKASIKVLAEIEIFDFAKEARFLYPFNYGDILNCVKALELNENNMCSTKAYTIKSTVNTSKASIKVLAEIEIFDFAKEARFLYPFNYGDILNCVKALELNENNMCSTKAYTIKSTVNTSKASIKVLAEIEIFDFAKEARFLYPFNYGDILNCVKALELNENNMCSTKAYTIKSTVNTSKASIKVLAEIEIFDFAKEARFLYPFNYGDILNCVKALELNENNMCSTKAYTIKSTVNTSKASIKVLAEIEIFDFAKEARFLYPFNYGDILNCVKALELNENNMCSTKAYTIKSTVNTSKASIKVLAEIEIFDFAKEARFLYPFNYGDILNCVKALELNENNMCSTKAYTIKSTVNTSKASIKVLAEIEIFDFAKEARFLYPFNYGDILNCVKALELNENNMCSTKAYTIKSTVNTSKASIKVLAEIEIFDFAKEARFLYPFNYGDILNCVKALELNENNMCSTKAYTIKSTVNTSKASIKVLAEIEIFDFAKEARFLYPFNYGDILNCVKALELNENNMCSTKAYTIKSTVNTSKASIKVLAEIEIFDFAKEARFLYPFNYGDILNCVKALELNENNMCSTKAYTIKSTVNTSKASIKVLAEIEIFDFAKEARFLYPFNYGDILNCVKALELNENNMCSTKAYTIKSTVNTSKASIKVLAEIEIFDFAKEARFLYPFNYGDILNCVKALELNENNMCSTKAYTIKSTVNTSKASIKVLAEIEIFDFAKEARFLYPFNYGDILNCVKALELNENNMCSTKAYTIKSTVNTSKASIKVLAEIEIFDFAKEARFLYPFNYGDILNCVKALELNENNMCSTKAYTIKSTVNTSKASIKVLAEIEIFDFAKEARFLYPFNYGDILNCVKALELNENNMCSTKAYTIKSTVNTSKASIKVLAEIEIFDFAKEARFLYPFNYGDILNCVKALELNENNMCSTKAYTIKSTVNTSKASIKVLAEIEIFDFAKEARFLYPFNYGDILNCVKALELNENNMCSTKAYTIKSTVNTSKASIKVLAEIEIFDFAKEARFLYPFNYGDILNCVKALELNENNMCSTKAYTIKSTVNTSKASIKVLAEIEIFDFAKEARFLYPFNYGDILNCVKALELNENNMCSTKAYTIKSTVNTSKASIKVLAEIEIFDFAKEARFLYPFNYGDILNCVKALELNENNMCSTKAYTIKSTVNTSKASIKVLAEIEIFDFAKEARFLYPFNYGDILNCVKALELNENNMCSTKAYTIKSTVNTSKASIKVLAEIEIFDFAKEARFLYPFNYGDILNCVKALELNENNMCSTKAYTIKSTVNTSKASIKVLAEIEIFDFAKEARFLYPFNYGDILNCVKALELNENNMCSTKAYTIKSTVNTSKASIKVLAEIEIFDFAKEARFLYPFNYGDILNCVKALELNENNMCSTKAYTIKSTVNTSKASIKVLAEIEIFDFAKEARFLYPFNYGDILNCVKALELNENNMCSTKAYTIKSTVNTSKASIKVLAEIEIFDFAKEARFLYPFNYGDILNCVKALELNENNMCSTKAYTIKSTVNTSKASIKVLAEIEIFDFAKEARFLYPFNYGDILNCVKALELNENNMCSTKAYTIKSTVNTSKASIKVLAEIEIFDFAKEARFLYPFNYGDILNCVKALELNENNMCSTKAYTIKSTVNTSKASIKVLAEIEIFDFAKEARFLYPFNYGDILNCVKALELNENNMCSTKAYTIKSTVNTSKASIKVLAEIEIFDFAKEARFLYPFNYGDILNCVKALELNENNMCSTKAYTIKSTVNTSKASIKVLAEIEIFDFAKEARFLYPFNYGDILNCVKALELNENNMCSTKAYTIKSTVNTSKASIKVLAEIEIFDFAKEARFLYPFNYGDIFGFTHV
ncbi:MAG: hypothetical protein DBY08_03460 [Clostridiales bacterium]|nr:MAG: hypothetical protein DBY08_03460 [Clostridiales bacterium]